MNKLHSLADFTLQCKSREILARVPVTFEDPTEGTMVIEVDAGMAEIFLDDVDYNEVEEILCKNILARDGEYVMPIADNTGDEPLRIKWTGNPHFLRQLRKPEFGAKTVAFVVTQGGLTSLQGLWPWLIHEVPFYH